MTDKIMLGEDWADVRLKMKEVHEILMEALYTCPVSEHKNAKRALHQIFILFRLDVPEITQDCYVEEVCACEDEVHFNCLGPPPLIQMPRQPHMQVVTSVPPLPPLTPSTRVRFPLQQPTGCENTASTHSTDESLQSAGDRSSVNISTKKNVAQTATSDNISSEKSFGNSPASSRKHVLTDRTTDVLHAGVHTVTIDDNDDDFSDTEDILSGFDESLLGKRRVSSGIDEDSSAGKSVLSVDKNPVFIRKGIVSVKGNAELFRRNIVTIDDESEADDENCADPDDNVSEKTRYEPHKTFNDAANSACGNENDCIFEQTKDIADNIENTMRDTVKVDGEATKNNGQCLNNKIASSYGEYTSTYSKNSSNIVENTNKGLKNTLNVENVSHNLNNSSNNVEEPSTHLKEAPNVSNFVKSTIEGMKNTSNVGKKTPNLKSSSNNVEKTSENSNNALNSSNNVKNSPPGLKSRPDNIEKIGKNMKKPSDNLDNTRQQPVNTSDLLNTTPNGVNMNDSANTNRCNGVKLADSNLKPIANSSNGVELTDSNHKPISKGSTSVKLTDSNHKPILSASNGVILTDSNHKPILSASNGVKLTDSNLKPISSASNGVKLTDSNHKPILSASNGVKLTDSNLKPISSASNGVKLTDSNLDPISSASAGAKPTDSNLEPIFSASTGVKLTDSNLKPISTGDNLTDSANPTSQAHETSKSTVNFGCPVDTVEYSFSHRMATIDNDCAVLLDDNVANVETIECSISYDAQPIVEYIDNSIVDNVANHVECPAENQFCEPLCEDNQFENLLLLAKISLDNPKLNDASRNRNFDPMPVDNREWFNLKKPPSPVKKRKKSVRFAAEDEYEDGVVKSPLLEIRKSPRKNKGCLRMDHCYSYELVGSSFDERFETSHRAQTKSTSDETLPISGQIKVSGPTVLDSGQVSSISGPTTQVPGQPGPSSDQTTPIPRRIASNMPCASLDETSPMKGSVSPRSQRVSGEICSTLTNSRPMSGQTANSSDQSASLTAPMLGQNKTVQAQIVTVPDKSGSVLEESDKSVVCQSRSNSTKFRRITGQNKPVQSATVSERSESTSDEPNASKSETVSHKFESSAPPRVEKPSMSSKQVAATSASASVSNSASPHTTNLASKTARISLKPSIKAQGNALKPDYRPDLAVIASKATTDASNAKKLSNPPAPVASRSIRMSSRIRSNSQQAGNASAKPSHVEKTVSTRRQSLNDDVAVGTKDGKIEKTKNQRKKRKVLVSDTESSSDYSSDSESPLRSCKNLRSSINAKSPSIQTIKTRQSLNSSIGNCQNRQNSTNSNSPAQNPGGPILQIKLEHIDKPVRNRPKIIHIDPKPVDCPACNFPDIKRWNFSAHLKRHMQLAGEKPMRCHVCGKNFTDLSTFHYHLQRHGSFRYGCTLCSKTFYREKLLKEHLNLHTDRKPFVCTVCAKAFHQSANLRIHMQTHVKAKEFICEHCQKGFKRKSHLKGHIVIHMSRKPFQCHKCGKRFSQKGNWRHHLSIKLTAWCNGPRKQKYRPRYAKKIKEE